MVYFKAIVDALLLIKGVWTGIAEWVKKRNEQRHKDAISKLDKAKSKQEVKDALNDISKNP